MNNKCYLGDSVYVDFDGWHIRLTTENGAGPSNEIFLEREVFYRLALYVKKVVEDPINRETLEKGE